jgi:hypothetical protein
MSERKEITMRLSQELEEFIDPDNDSRIYWAKEVTFDYATNQPVRVDYMRFVPLNNSASGIEKGDFYCYEIKSSLEDFRSKNGHNFIGDYNYYVIPENVYEHVEKEIPFGIGALIERKDSFGNHYLELKKKARRKDRNKSVSEMLLMMFRSANRELRKENEK